jgi:hypothetical protein
MSEENQAVTEEEIETAAAETAESTEETSDAAGEESSDE